MQLCLVLNVCLGHGSPHSLNPVETQFTSVVSVYRGHGSPHLMLEQLGCRVQVIRGGDGHGSPHSELLKASGCRLQVPSQLSHQPQVVTPEALVKTSLEHSHTHQLTLLYTSPNKVKLVLPPSSVYSRPTSSPLCFSGSRRVIYADPKVDS